MDRSNVSRWTRLLSLGVATLMIGGLVVATASAQASEPQQSEEQAARQARAVREAQLALERALAESKAALGEAHARSESQMRRALAEVEMQRRNAARARAIQDRVRVLQDDARSRVRLRTSPRIAIALGGHGGSADRVLAMAEELELTEAQQEQIRDARRAHRRARIARDADIEVAELDLEELMDDITTADLASVEAKMREISDLRVQERMAGLRLDRTVHGILTAEQREQLDDGPHEFRLRSGGPAAYFFGDDGDFEFGEFSFDELEPRRWGGTFEFDGERLFPGRWMERFENLPYGVWRFGDRDDDEDEGDDEDDEETKDKKEREGIKT